MDTNRMKRDCHCCGGVVGQWHHSDCVEIAKEAAKVKSDGSSTDYYRIPDGATDLIDLIEHKNMGFSVGNIFKACYRLGEKHGTDAMYDLNKIIFFAERMKRQIENN
jgi:hypothetical protein